MLSSLLCTDFSLAGGEQASCCDGFSCGAQAVGQAGFSSCSLQALEHGPSSCGSWALLLFGMWDFPRPRDQTHVSCPGW